MIRLLSLLLFLSLTACTTPPTRPPAELPPEQSWQLRQKQLRILTHWQITGRLAVQSEDEAWQMNLEWQQRQEHYSLNITAPLGMGSMQMHGDATQVELITDDGESLSGGSPDLLLYHQLGWKVPVSALRYWVLGLPAPGEFQPTLDEYGRLSHLQQSGWQIKFIDYQPQLGTELPRKVFIENHRARVRLVISTWQSLPLLPEGSHS